MRIEKVDNGYITESIYGQRKVHENLESVFEEILLHYEGRSIFFDGDNFGAVEIHREHGEKYKEVEPT